MDFPDFGLGGAMQRLLQLLCGQSALILKNSYASRSAAQTTPLTEEVGYIGINGGRTWARTKDPLIKSQLLYQLSYASIAGLRQGGEAVSPAGGALLAEHVRPAKGVFDIFLAVGTRTSDPDPL
jgi:hypothetical protein